MGHARVTVRNLEVVRVIPEQNLLMVKGAVPGPNRGLLLIQKAKAGRKQKLQEAV
jgi:large subunit ribosomal protein L3